MYDWISKVYFVCQRRDPITKQTHLACMQKLLNMNFLNQFRSHKKINQRVMKKSELFPTPNKIFIFPLP